MPRPPRPPGGSQQVIIEPVRAGTSFYHTHGEPGRELTQGLYGPFIVLEPGEPWDRTRDRVFVLSSRGAEMDSPPSVNGRTAPEPERFEPGEAVRLRFAHISADAYKRVRLTRDGETVRWLPWAKDGANLPAAARIEGPAQFGIGVGEAVDVRWTPEEPGVYVLEITTEFYPSRGGSDTQRVAFAVGAVTDAELRVATTGTDAMIVGLTASEGGRYVGTYVSAEGAVFPVWTMPEGLYGALEVPGQQPAPEPYLAHLGDGVFMPGVRDGGLVRTPASDQRVRFVEEAGAVSAIEILQGEGVTLRLARVDEYSLPPEQLEALAGRYTSEDLPVEAVVSVVEGALRFGIGQEPGPMVALSPRRFSPVPTATSPMPYGVVLSFFGTGAEQGFRVMAPDGFAATFQRVAEPSN